MSTNWRIAFVALLTLAAGGCSVANQVHADLQYRQLVDSTVFLGREGIGILTPSAPTGQEADRQALADALGEILDRDVEEADIVALPALLSAVNQAGLARMYSNMFAEYDRTGILDRDMLRQVGEAADVRYLAKLNLGNFKQEAASRVKLLGVRFLDTRTATIRVHLEIWDAHTGGIVWQGNEELTFAQERVREKPVTFQQVANLAAERLVAKVGESGREVVREETEEAVAAADRASRAGSCDGATLAALAAAPAIEPVAYTTGC
jgi:hypothetical protein